MERFTVIWALLLLGLCIIANRVLNGHIAGVDSAVLKSGPIGKWQV